MENTGGIVPNFQDLVKHINGDVFGTVIAKYVSPINNKTYVDVRGDQKIYYASPVENWVVIEPYVE